MLNNFIIIILILIILYIINNYLYKNIIYINIKYIYKKILNYLNSLNNDNDNDNDNNDNNNNNINNNNNNNNINNNNIDKDCIFNYNINNNQEIDIDINDIIDSDKNNVKLDNQIKLVNNLKTWYPNRWIETVDKNNNPIYNESNNQIFDEYINIDNDINNIAYINQNNFNEKPIKFIYDNLVENK